MEDGAPAPPLSITEFEEWQAFYKLKAEHMSEHGKELEAKLKHGKGKRGAPGDGPDTDPPVIGSGRKKGGKKK